MHCPVCRVAVEDVDLTVSEELRYFFLSKVEALQWAWLYKEILIRMSEVVNSCTTSDFFIFIFPVCFAS